MITDGSSMIAGITSMPKSPIKMVYMFIIRLTVGQKYSFLKCRQKLWIKNSVISTGLNGHGYTQTDYKMIHRFEEKVVVV